MNDVTFSGPSSAADSKGRIDFISELPFDIVTDNIIPRILDYDHQPLNLHEEWIYFSVCSSWSQRIASSGMAIRIEGHWLLTKEDWMCIKALAPYIQRLLLPMGAPDSICNLLEYARLSSLITLTITITGTQDLWCQLLGSIPNLSCLHIKYRQMHTNRLAIFHFMEHCPKLHRLKISLQESDRLRIRESSNSSSTFPNLLYLTTPEPVIASTFYRHLPGLRTLHLTDYPSDHEALHRIHQWCPRLQEMFLGSYGESRETKDEMTQQGGIDGLRSLSIRPGSIHGNRIAALLMTHGATLESFHMLGPLSCPPRTRISVEHAGVFEKLRYMTYSSGLNAPSLDLIRWIAIRAPNLQIVEATNEAVEGIILEPLINCPMTRINLEYLLSSTDDSAEYRFIQRQVQLGMDSSLQFLKCNIIKPLSDYGGWMHLIPALQQLRSLDLRLVYHGDVKTVDILLRLISKGCPSLEEIALDICPFSFPADLILPLSQHVRLQKLTIATETIPIDISTLLENFRHLGSLHLQLVYVDWEVIENLKCIMPRLVCTMRKGRL